MKVEAKRAGACIFSNFESFQHENWTQFLRVLLSLYKLIHPWVDWDVPFPNMRPVWIINLVKVWVQIGFDHFGRWINIWNTMQVYSSHKPCWTLLYYRHYLQFKKKILFSSLSPFFPFFFFSWLLLLLLLFYFF